MHAAEDGDDVRLDWNDGSPISSAPCTRAAAAGHSLEQLRHLDLGGVRGVSTRWGAQVKDLMTRQLVTATPRTSVETAADRLRKNHISCLPVFRGSKLVGIVTRSDVLAAIARHP